MYYLGARSIKRLEHVHPKLVLVIGLALKYLEVDITILEGARDIERQKYLMRTGKSWVKNPESSFHILDEKMICHAVDIGAWVNGTVSWDWTYYFLIEKAMKRAAKELKIEIEWGGDWKSVPADGPHWQTTTRN